MPIFTNQKDVSNQARKQSQLRAPLSKALIAGASSQGGGDSSSAKNSHSTSSNQAYSSNASAVNNSTASLQNNANSNSESRGTESNLASSNQQKNNLKAGEAKEVLNKTTGSATNTLFPFEPFK